MLVLTKDKNKKHYYYKLEPKIKQLVFFLRLTMTLYCSFCLLILRFSRARNPCLHDVLNFSAGKAARITVGVRERAKAQLIILLNVLCGMTLHFESRLDERETVNLPD
jgi:hypothetical protein